MTLKYKQNGRIVAAFIATILLTSAITFFSSPPVFSDGNVSPSACEGGPTDSNGGNTVIDAGSGNIVTGICIKSGTNSFGIGVEHSGLITIDGTYGTATENVSNPTPPPGQIPSVIATNACYTVDFSPNGQIVTVTETGISGCKGISHVDYFTEAVPPEEITTLTVIKILDNGDTGSENTVDDFSFFVNGDKVEEGVETEFDPGDYTVTEGGPSGYSTEFSDDCDDDGNVTLELGDAKTCTITNTAIPPTLTVIKIVINDNTGESEPSDFEITINGVTVLGGDSNPFPGKDDSGTTRTVTIGEYSVTEDGPSGYEATFSEDCEGTLELGDAKTCTITNDDIPPTRSQGYWATHHEHATSLWTSTTVCGKLDVDDPEMEGGFWANVAKTTTGAKRSALDQARMGLVQQLEAAILNELAFGTLSGSTIADAETACVGTDVTAIKNAKSALEAFNLSGESAPAPTVGNANPTTAQTSADKAFWNSFP